MEFQNRFPLILKTSHTFFNFGCYKSFKFNDIDFVIFRQKPCEIGNEDGDNIWVAFKVVSYLGSLS